MLGIKSTCCQRLMQPSQTENFGPVSQSAPHQLLRSIQIIFLCPTYFSCLRDVSRLDYDSYKTDSIKYGTQKDKRQWYPPTCDLGSKYSNQLVRISTCRCQKGRQVCTSSRKKSMQICRRKTNSYHIQREFFNCTNPVECKCFPL